MELDTQLSAANPQAHTVGTTVCERRGCLHLALLSCSSWLHFVAPPTTSQPACHACNALPSRKPPRTPSRSQLLTHPVPLGASSLADLSHLISWRGMGVARVNCTSGCACAPVDINAQDPWGGSVFINQLIPVGAGDGAGRGMPAKEPARRPPTHSQVHPLGPPRRPWPDSFC